MGTGKVIDVDVVPQASSIGCSKIITENGDMLALAQGNLQDNWN